MKISNLFPTLLLSSANFNTINYGTAIHHTLFAIWKLLERYHCSPPFQPKISKPFGHSPSYFRLEITGIGYYPRNYLPLHIFIKLELYLVLYAGCVARQQKTLNTLLFLVRTRTLFGPWYSNIISPLTCSPTPTFWMRYTLSSLLSIIDPIFTDLSL